MVYILAAVCAAYLLVIGCLAKFSKEPIQNTFVILSVLMAFLTGVTTTIFGLIGYARGSTIPLKEYAQLLHQEIPELKGKLVCDNNKLSFEGTMGVDFTWKENPYLVNYPVSVPFHYDASSCLLNVHTSPSNAILTLRQHQDASRTSILQSLSQNVVPSDLEGEPRKLTMRLINTLNPARKKTVSTFSTAGAPSDQLIVHQTAAPVLTDILVPKQQMHGNTKVTTLTVQELQSNISGQ